jgi:hypothetical protein
VLLLRLIGKWLKAGVLEAGEMAYPEKTRLVTFRRPLRGLA